MPATDGWQRTGLVLGGGGARGAYEAGVLGYLRDELQPRLEHGFLFEIICGTSVGAINACFLSSTAALPGAQGIDLETHWRNLKLTDVLRIETRSVLRLARDSLGRPRPRLPVGLVDIEGLQRVLLRTVHWRGIGRALRAGALDALAVGATQLTTGRSIVFVQQREGLPPPWSGDPYLIATETRIGPRHALASSAIPLLFPAVRIGTELYADGALGLNVPVSPVLRLGAERLVMVSLRHVPGPAEPVPRAPPAITSTAPFLFGKTLNALLLDRQDQDIERLRRINELLEAGTEAFGSQFPELLNRALLPHSHHPVRQVDHVVVRPSVDIGRLAADFSRSPDFRRRTRGFPGTLIRMLVDREGGEVADLVSYVLFDPGFTELLIDLGRRDARRMEEEWARFFLRRRPRG